MKADVFDFCLLGKIFDSGALSESLNGPSLSY